MTNPYYAGDGGGQPRLTIPTMGQFQDPAVQVAMQTILQWSGRLLLGGGGAAGDLIGFSFYAPGPGAGITYNGPGSGAVRAADAVNLTVPFIAPASGNVFVRLTADSFFTDTAGGRALMFCLIEHGTGTTQVGPAANVLGPNQAVSVDVDLGATVSAVIPVTGLTPGASEQYDFGLGGPGTNGIQVGTPDGFFLCGPASMEVFSYG
jgi:hypothetical protein